ncbi:hypothetical protein GSI_13238 [Ganoderma sinense ZZ0214-1]|uniref:Uncharacterized protein n=1 Tax=Ganoderma sinense ZZ0214-1 TaxID=1077348 RepID=A0A2G8RV28_9APHY|nr:hypothetical protein GSI_13238 [Ganoderma sinense ZZ0214-1]
MNVAWLVLGVWVWVAILILRLRVFSTLPFVKAVVLTQPYFNQWSNLKAHAYTLPIVSLSLSLGAFADLLIAITFSTYLLRGGNQYSHASRTLTNMLTLYAINTGAATVTDGSLVKHHLCYLRDRGMSLCTRWQGLARPLLTTLVAKYGSVRSSLAFLVLSEMGAKPADAPAPPSLPVRPTGISVYANSFLGSLNFRAFLRHKNLARGFSGFRPSTNSDNAMDVQFGSFPSEDCESPPLAREPPVLMVEFDGGTVCEARAPGSESCVSGGDSAMKAGSVI